MKKAQNYLIILFLRFSISWAQKPTEVQSPNTVHFPEVSEPIQLVDIGRFGDQEIHSACKDPGVEFPTGVHGGLVGHFARFADHLQRFARTASSLTRTQFH